MKGAKTPLLKYLIKQFQTARILRRHPELDADTLLQLQNADLPSRRKFLKDSAKTLAILGAGSMLPLAACNLDKPKAATPPTAPPGSLNGAETKKQPVVAIVGAGIAGLNCAYQLSKKGITAQIFEASNRSGGRISTGYDFFAKGSTTEMGGEFVDTNHEDMHALAAEFGLEMNNLKDDIKKNKLKPETYLLQDKLRTERSILLELAVVGKKIDADLEKCGEDYDTPFCAELDKTSLEEYVKHLRCSTWVQDLFLAAYVAEFGLDAAEQSALNFIDMLSTDVSDGFAIFGDSDEAFKIQGGNSGLINAMTNRLQNQIQMGKKLVAVRNAGTGYLLVFEGGGEVKADFVVMTMPFSVLRNLEFNLEGMTPEKKACIQELGYGMNNKLLLGFDSRFWREKKSRSAGYLFNEKIHNGWDNTHNQLENRGPGGYTIFLGGKRSLDLAEVGSKGPVPDRLVAEYLDTMNQAFPGIKSHYNNVQRTTLWSSNPYSGGSYSCYKPGQWTSISGQEIEPIGNVFFAGEHCSSDFQGYMNGGAETGRRAAEQIFKILSPGSSAIPVPDSLLRDSMKLAK